MDFGHVQQKGVEGEEQDHVGVNDLHFASKMKENKIPPFDLPLYLFGNPLDTFLVRNIHSKRGSKVSKNSAFVNNLPMLRDL